ncbi:vicilin-like seed storage protein At2g18540 [Pseudomyrmex gracilis]|uniref:vicilin-like seed storage protein At2g18540 n=1 Tax=Pseudomyrmex gracilis TaxID=219809 RepID=UPI00099591AE|nr:vicilin-like seed storage protein At2g18540 [Pseudomyrmex gracilis]
MILNGSNRKQGEWKYIGEQGASVIDYVVTNEKAIEEVRKVEEGSRTESDHVPMEVEIEGIRRKRRKESGCVEVKRSVWSVEGIEHYHEKCEGCTETNIEEMWSAMENKVKESIMRVKKKVTPWRLGRKEWHSKEWKEKKRELRRKLRKLKKDKIKREEYVRKRREYRKWCEGEKKKHEEEEEEKIRSIRTEEEAWRYINKYRKKRERVDEGIELHTWNEHFMELLGGTKERVIMEEEEERRGE